MERVWGDGTLGGDDDLLELFSFDEVTGLQIEHQIAVLMVPVAVDVLEVVEGVILMVPGFDDDGRIYLAVQGG